MPYHIPAESIIRKTVKERIINSHLIPSRNDLKGDAKLVFSQLATLGIANLADLRKALHTKSKLEDYAASSEISPDRITLLRREIESRFPKAVALKGFNRLILALEKLQIKDTEKLFQRFEKGSELLHKIIGKDAQIEKTLKTISNLCRGQWTNATAARMLILAGIDSTRALADSDDEIPYF
ncbi:MAG TPA: hypothetical protein ENN84_10050 [Candidatus Marinimicrobia bacterium]|nr:hypothetical protein [Candidatus Neomarinimicrobiota bacterium]